LEARDDVVEKAVLITHRNGKMVRARKRIMAVQARALPMLKGRRRRMVAEVVVIAFS